MKNARGVKYGMKIDSEAQIPNTTNGKRTTFHKLQLSTGRGLFFICLYIPRKQLLNLTDHELDLVKRRNRKR